MIRERVERKLEKSGRITPREVLEAYEETGLKIARDVYQVGDRACAIGVLMARDGIRLDGDEQTLKASFAIDDWEKERIEYVGEYYCSGFVNAFDGGIRPDEPSDDGPWEYGSWWWEALGYRDGQRVRKFVLSRLSNQLENS